MPFSSPSLFLCFFSFDEIVFFCDLFTRLSSDHKHKNGRKRERESEREQAEYDDC
jgi:hypothetical protein